MNELVSGWRRPWLAWLGLGLGLGCNDPADSGATDDPTETAGASTESGTTASASTESGTSTDPGVTTHLDSGTSDAAETDTGDSLVCPEALGGLMVGEACVANAACASLICLLHTDAPPDLDATCAAPPPSCGMRITGTALDIVTRQPVAGADVMVFAPFIALLGGTPITTTASDEAGIIDVVTPEPVDSPVLGIGIMQEAPGFTLTATSVAVSTMANEVHDLWLVSNDAVVAWSAMLSVDPEIPPEALPLGDAGGFVGLVRDASGMPLAGATVTSTDDGSEAVIRHLSNDGTFNTTATQDLGLFVILAPSLAEEFEVERDGVIIGSLVLGSADDVVMAAAITAP